MRVLITVDLEGISDVVAVEEIFRNSPDEFQQARKKMTREAAALCKGILAVVPDAEIVVHDFHGDARNIDHEELPQPVELVRGTNAVPIDSGFDMYMLLGNHARYGSQHGVICHTYTGMIECRINQQPIGEFQLLAGLAGEYGVPTVLVSGDLAAVQQAKESALEIITVVTKYGIDGRSTRCRHPDVVHAELRDGAARAIRSCIKPLVYATPFLFTVTTTREFVTDQFDWIPGIKRTGARSLEYNARSMAECHQILLGLIKIRVPL